jgi:hypothetical protein
MSGYFIPNSSVILVLNITPPAYKRSENDQFPPTAKVSIWR